jgi:hypothetical protein
MDLRIAVCIPSGGDWKQAFGQSLVNMINCVVGSENPHGTKEVEVFGVSGSMLPETRHRCVAEALKWDATHILWLDDDMIFPRDTIQVLLRHNLPVVGANYCRRSHPHLPTAHKGGDNGIVYTTDESAGVEEVKHLGMGCVLTDARIYECVDLPFFQFEPKEDGVGVIGEDVFFFKKLKDAGIPTYVDHDLSKHVGHVMDFPLPYYASKSAEQAREAEQQSVA